MYVYGYVYVHTHFSIIMVLHVYITYPKPETLKPRQTVSGSQSHCSTSVVVPHPLRVMGFRAVGARAFGFRGLGFRVLGCRAIGLRHIILGLGLWGAGRGRGSAFACEYYRGLFWNIRTCNSDPCARPGGETIASLGCSEV